MSHSLLNFSDLKASSATDAGIIFQLGMNSNNVAKIVKCTRNDDIITLQPIIEEKLSLHV